MIAQLEEIHRLLSKGSVNINFMLARRRFSKSVLTESIEFVELAASQMRKLIEK